MNPTNSHHKYFEFAYQTGSDIWTHIPLHKKTLSFLPKQENALILDIGCGRGNIIFELIKQNYRILGIDYIESVIDSLNKKLKERKLSDRARGINGNIYSIPFTDSSFDIALDIGTFQHRDKNEREKYIHELSRILKKDGYYLNVSLSKKTTSLLGFNPSVLKEDFFEKFNLPYYFFTKEQVQKIFSKNFKIIKQEEETYPSQSDPHDEIILLFTLMQKK